MKSIAVKTTFAVAVLAFVAGGLGCGGEDRSQVDVELFGWTGSGFTMGMPQFDGADELRVQVTNPEQREVVNEQTIAIDRRSSRMPEVPGGAGLRMEFEVLGDDEPIASGATPIFDIQRDGAHHGYRTMISEINEFAPVGSRRSNPETGESEIAESTFDIRQFDDDVEWSGRLGHAAEPTESGEILVAGGFRLGDSWEPGERPVVRDAFDDIQLFDPSTGYFTELAGDSAARSAGAEGEDRLQQPRGFHTLTPLGNDRFVVAGGFVDGQGSTDVVDSVELIDLNAPAGQRVQQLEGVELAEARGLHTATYRDSDGRVVVAGGLATSSDDVVDSIEIIDPDPEAPDIESGIAMQSPRVGHEALLLEDGETVWLIGGKSGSPLDSTELIAGDDAVADGPQLQNARYHASALHLGDEANNQILVVGGITSQGATGNYEMGNPLQGEPGDDWALDSGGDWELDSPRGGPGVQLLEQSGDVAVVGGFDESGDPVGSAERMTLVETVPPFDVDSTFGPMHHPRIEPSVSMVDNGRILLVGGDSPDTAERNDAEYFNIYDPVAP